MSEQDIVSNFKSFSYLQLINLINYSVVNYLSTSPKFIKPVLWMNIGRPYKSIPMSPDGKYSLRISIYSSDKFKSYIAQNFFRNL